MSAQAKHGAESSPLVARLKGRIAREGPISVHDYMEACLADRAAGYYLTHQPIGRDGDFITAPEISQIFGELIGAWAATVWQGMGAPAHLIIAELGPGRGTLMADALRVFKTVPKLLDNATLTLVETSPMLRQLQQKTLRSAPAPLRWFERLEDVPDGPLILIANEFVDALPVRQFMRVGVTWRERCVGFAADGTLGFYAGRAVETDAPTGFARGFEVVEGAIAEMRPAAGKLLAGLGERAKHAPLAALIADYGNAESGFGDSLQAVRAHRYADPFSAPGEVDLTAHVDFAALKENAKALGLVTFGTMPQGEFLLKLGLAERAEHLTRNAAPEKRQAILSGATRLTDPRQMGVLFKVLVLQSSGLAPPPPFGDI